MKIQYTGIAGAVEQALEGYVCDGIRENGELIEIQTGSFGPLKHKAPVLAAAAPLRIVHPIVAARYIELFDEAGSLLRRRKSPRKGTPWDLFNALIYAPLLPRTANLCIELAVVETAERRIQDGKGSWRRKGASIEDKILLAVRETIPLSGAGDYIRFIPFKKNEPFTVQTLAEKAGITAGLARKTLYVLFRLELVKRTGKQGNAWVYKRGK
ncbi:hypothetical protein JFL75_10505 [Breznakiella homolactica]|uniref:DUF8091 domain-containing protein n=1 Tax=Breznakiella homolactica TaxID=2798577 RepID=A0A7T7XRX9_9SPIR|nr:hypothetical protein JFL75_10505 [Breznakiella homolactica]